MNKINAKHRVFFFISFLLYNMGKTIALVNKGMLNIILLSISKFDFLLDGKVNLINKFKDKQTNKQKGECHVVCCIFIYIYKYIYTIDWYNIIKLSDPNRRLVLLRFQLEY